MYGTLSEERVANVLASEAWNLYGALELAKLVGEKVKSGIISNVNVVQGDGGVGTVIELSVRTGDEGMIAYKEKFTVVDNEKRVKEAEIIEGGFLDLGFTYYRVRFEVIEKEGCEEQCITKATIEYEFKKEDNNANKNIASLVSIDHLVSIMHVANDHLEKNYNRGKY